MQWKWVRRVKGERERAHTLHFTLDSFRVFVHSLFSLTHSFHNRLIREWARAFLFVPYRSRLLLIVWIEWLRGEKTQLNSASITRRYGQTWRTWARDSGPFLSLMHSTRLHGSPSSLHSINKWTWRAFHSPTVHIINEWEGRETTNLDSPLVLVSSHHSLVLVSVLTSLFIPSQLTRIVQRVEWNSTPL